MESKKDIPSPFEGHVDIVNEDNSEKNLLLATASEDQEIDSQESVSQSKNSGGLGDVFPEEVFYDVSANDWIAALIDPNISVSFTEVDEPGRDNVNKELSDVTTGYEESSKVSSIVGKASVIVEEDEVPPFIQETETSTSGMEACEILEANFGMLTNNPGTSKSVFGASSRDYAQSKEEEISGTGKTVACMQSQDSLIGRNTFENSDEGYDAITLCNFMDLKKGDVSVVIEWGKYINFRKSKNVRSEVDEKPSDEPVEKKACLMIEEVREVSPSNQAAGTSSSEIVEADSTVSSKTPTTQSEDINIGTGGTSASSESIDALFADLIEASKMVEFVKEPIPTKLPKRKASVNEESFHEPTPSGSSSLDLVTVDEDFEKPKAEDDDDGSKV